MCKGFMFGGCCTDLELPAELETPSDSILDALHAYNRHVLSVLPDQLVTGLFRFYTSSMKRHGISIPETADTSIDTLVEIASSSELACRRFLACVAYYLSPHAVAVGDGHSAAVALLLKK